MQWVANYSTWIYLLIVLIAAGLSYWAYWRTQQRVFNIPQRLVLTGFRFVEYLLLGFILFSPLLLLHTSKTLKPQVVIALDKSKSVGKLLPADARASLNETLLSGIKKISERYDIDTFLFGDKVREGFRGDYKDAHTDMSQLSEYISDRYYEQPLREILIITDGYANRGPSPFGHSYLLGTPITAVAIGDTLATPDFAVSVVYTPHTVLTKNDIVVNLEASCKNSRSRSATLQVSIDGRVVTSEAVSFDYQDDIISRQLSIPSGAPGMHSVCVKILSAEKEYNLSNNQKCNSVRVTDEKLSIALCYQSVHPDVAAIKRALETQQNISIKEYRGVPSSISENMVIAHNLQDPSAIGRVLSSGRPYWLISGLRGNVQAWTRDKTIKSKSSDARESKANFNSSFDYFDKSFVDEGVIAAWPPLVQPASVAAFASNSESLLRSGSGFDLLTYSTGARPRVITAGEGMWRWRMSNHRTRQNTQMFDAMIQQTVMFLKQSKRKNDFQVQLSRSSVPMGESVVWNAQFYNQNMELDNTPTVEVNIKGPGITRQLQMNKTQNDYLLVAQDFPPGNYTYTATLKAKGLSKSLSGRFEVQNIDIEAAVPYANMPLLQHITQRWDGEVLTPDGLQSWFDRVDQKEYPDTIVNERTWKDAIDLRWLMLWLVFLLITEWLLRKLWGSL